MKSIWLQSFLSGVISMFSIWAPAQSVSNYPDKDNPMAVQQIVLLENQAKIIPLKRLDTLKLAVISFGDQPVSVFSERVSDYLKSDDFAFNQAPDRREQDSIVKLLNNYNLILICPTGNVKGEWRWMNRMTAKKIAFIRDNSDIESMVGMEPDGLLYIPDFSVKNQDLAAQAVFGGIGPLGKLNKPLGRFQEGTGLVTGEPVRLGYGLPEGSTVQWSALGNKLDSVIQEALTRKAFPGCNLLIAYQGKVIYQKAYGYHTYENIVPTRLQDMYDLASVTKVTSALPAIMRLTGEGKINLDVPFSDYWTDWKKRPFHFSDKADVTLRELLAHQAGLTPFIPFWKATLEHGKLSSQWYRVDQDGKYDLMVAPGLYLKHDFKQYIYKTIRKTPLKDRGKYVYSDLFFVMAPDFISGICHGSYIRYLDSCFYKPLGAGTVTYLPTLKFSADRIIPTENDQYYRKRQLLGAVHDESAACLGGISGNAGLFANAGDLAKLLQMYLQMGTYGGERYIPEAVLKEFTRVQYPQNHNRRGLGFDKPLPGNQNLKLEDAYPAPDASMESFGHSGYTGTFFWIDPSNQLVYILLANRVFPTRENNVLSELNLRVHLHQMIYEALKIK